MKGSDLIFCIRLCLFLAVGVAGFFPFRILASYSSSAPTYERDPRDRDFYYGQQYLTNDPYWRYGFETFQKQLAQFKIPPRGDALAHFLQTLPTPFINSYVIMYESRSLQDASERFPRIIVFSPRADFVIAFNGHPKQHGFNQLEVMHFDYQESVFVFHEVSFSAGKKPVLSEKNPQKCLNCHQSPNRININPRPNWEPYALWPGAIGSNNGLLYTSLLSRLSQNLEPLKFTKEEEGYLKKQSQEARFLRQFMQFKSQSPRYKWLGDLGLNLKDPYLDVKQPTALTEQFGNLNAKRVLRLIKNDSQAQKLIIPFTHAIRCRFVAADSFTRAWLQTHNVRPTIMNERLIDFHTNERLLGFAEMLSLIFEPFGINTEDWSMDFKTQGRFAHADRFTTPNSIFSHFDRALDFEFPEQRQWNCAELAEKSQQILRTQMEEFILKQPTTSLSHLIVNPDPLKKALQNCLSCHGDFISAPYIPFDSPQELKNYLRLPAKNLKDRSTRHKKYSRLEDMLFRLSDLASGAMAMPLHRQLPYLEREALINYVKELSQTP